MYELVRAGLFALPPETAHALAAHGLDVGHRLGLLARHHPPPELAQELMGLRFASPLGLAAGFDKDGKHIEALLALGFGSVEAGTVTSLPQPGNPRPRLFRLPADRAIINRMGFNNLGSAPLATRLGAEFGGVVGANIGKSKVTALADAAADYRLSARRLGPVADYIVVNVSSPNTPGLRDLQAVSGLRPILTAVVDELSACNPAPPVLVKIAPDLADDDVAAVADLAMELGIAGVVACNTTIGRAGLQTDKAIVAAMGKGGLSGPPVAKRSEAVLKALRQRMGKDAILVAAGGIESATDAWGRLCAGANLLQVYTGFVYGGPALPRRIHAGLVNHLRQSGLATIAETRALWP